MGIMTFSRLRSICLLVITSASLLSLAACAGNQLQSETFFTSIQDKANENIARNISPVEAFDLLSINSTNTDLVILDIRTPEERTLAYIKGSILLDWHSGYSQQIISLLDKSKTYLIY